VCVCVCAFSVGGTALSVVFIVCVDGGGGGTKAAMSRPLEFNDVCGKVCVFLCLCRGGGCWGGGVGGLPSLQVF